MAQILINYVFICAYKKKQSASLYNQGELSYCTTLKKEDIMAKKVTSAKVASKASKVLQDGRSSARTKSVAASALSQREKKK